MYIGVRTLFECMAERWPDLIQKLIEVLPPRNDSIEVTDLTNWAELKMPLSAEAIIMRRCHHDDSLIRYAEDWLLDRLILKENPHVAEGSTDSV